MSKATQDFKNLSDEELMRTYAQGEYGAFEQLYSRHSARVYGYVLARVGNKSRADEIFQEVFLKLHRFRSRFRADLPFLPWLFTLARNVIVDALRSDTRQKLEASGADADLEVHQASLTEDPRAKDLEQAIGLLASQEQAALNLRFNSDLPYDQIATRLGISISNSRQLVSRALKRLRRSFLGGND